MLMILAAFLFMLCIVLSLTAVWMTAARGMLRATLFAAILAIASGWLLGGSLGRVQAEYQAVTGSTKAP